jgi:hypothetical protein
MRFVGKGVYHHGPGGIEQPGDFGWKIELDRTYTDGLAADVVKRIYFVQHCQKYGVCMIKVHQAPPDHGTATWQWDGNWEEPTIHPSIGCDNAPRCGAHRTIIRGQPT